MKIGLLAAMTKELNLLLPMIENRSTSVVNGLTFYTGNIGNHEVVCSECGIGKVNAAIGALTLIDNFAPDIVINSGVAGGTGQEGINILDVLVADKVAYHDVWCGPGTEPGVAAGCPETFNCPLPSDFFAGMDIKRGLIASGDIFVSQRSEVDKILSVWPQAVAVDMESAAIAQTCYLKGVKFLCIRVISDTPGAADNIAQYTNFWTDAPDHTFKAVKTVISRL